MDVEGNIQINDEGYVAGYGVAWMSKATRFEEC